MKKELPLRIVVTLAMLSAISIVAGKYLKIDVGEVLRFSFENLPIIFAAIAFGPICGALVGTVADLLGCLLVGYAINPLVTVGAATIGLVSGCVWIIVKRLTIGLPYKIGITVGVCHVIGSVIVKTIGLAAFFSMPLPILMLWRLLNYAIVGGLEGGILYFLMKNKLVTNQIKALIGKGEQHKSLTYEEALAFIHGQTSSFCKPGLERISRLCEALGNPQDELKYVHIGGTNGKGSTSSMLSSILREQGLRVGLYTSPYIYRFNERIQINGESIPDRALIDLVKEIRPICNAMTDKPTEFEIITAMAFRYFAQQGCDVVVLEVGLGGRLDSTNIIKAPLLSIVTGISLDHIAILGDTIEKIAYEKAGIIKPGAPVLYGGDSNEAYDVIRGVAVERGSEIKRTERAEITNCKMSLSGGSFDYKEWREIELSLLGEYQFYNAAVVLEAVQILRNYGVKIDTGAVYRGIKAAKWPARFEILSDNPTVIFDGAHNEEGVRAATQSIEKYYPSGDAVVFSGVLRDKDYKTIAKSISTVASTAFTVTPDNARALSAEEWAQTLNDEGVRAVACESTEEALRLGVEYATREGKPMFCLGSLYTYSTVVDTLKKILSDD